MGFFNDLFSGVKKTIKSLDESLEHFQDENEKYFDSEDEVDEVENDNESKHEPIKHEPETQKCTTCDATLKTNAYSKMLKCEYCGQECVNENYSRMMKNLGDDYKFYHYPVLVESSKENPSVYDAQFEIFADTFSNETEALDNIAKSISDVLQEYYEECEKTPVITEEKLLSKRYVKKALEKGGRIEYVDVWVREVMPNEDNE